MATTFTVEGGASVSFENATLVKLNDGRNIAAENLSNGDTFLIRRDDWATINSVPVVV